MTFVAGLHSWFTTLGYTLVTHIYDAVGLGSYDSLLPFCYLDAHFTPFDTHRCSAFALDAARLRLRVPVPVTQFYANLVVIPARFRLRFPVRVYGLILRPCRLLPPCPARLFTVPNSFRRLRRTRVCGHLTLLRCGYGCGYSGCVGAFATRTPVACRICSCYVIPDVTGLHTHYAFAYFAALVWFSGYRFPVLLRLINPYFDSTHCYYFIPFTFLRRVRWLRTPLRYVWLRLRCYALLDTHYTTYRLHGSLRLLVRYG